MYHAIQQYYRVDATEVSALLVKSLNIWHPYGTVGSLPWLTNSDNQIDYGATPNAPQLRDLAQQIRTFTESKSTIQNTLNKIDDARSNILNSQKIIFLGFSFLKQNMDLVLPSVEQTDKPSNSNVFATAYGISLSDKRSIKDELQGRMGTAEIKITDRKCMDLFKEYNRAFSYVHKY